MSTDAEKNPKLPERATKPTTLAELQRSRELVAPGPSGHAYRITFVNLQRQALTGSLPATIRKAALAGAQGVNRFFGGDDEKLNEEGEQMKEWLDQLVGQVILEPRLLEEDGKTLKKLSTPVTLADGKKLEYAIELVPAFDYKWALEIAFMEEDRDGDGRLLWGREPLSKWETFRSFHECSEDCPGCEALRDDLSAPRGGAD